MRPSSCAHLARSASTPGPRAIRLHQWSTRSGVAARAAAPVISDGPSEQQLLQQIAEKESQLAAIFDRRPLPKATEVAALRGEITSLKAALPQRPAPPVARPRSAPKQEDLDLAARVFAQLDAGLSNTAPGNSEDREIVALEAENMALRADAHALLQHQALLERLVDEARAAQEEGERALREGSQILGRMREKLGSNQAAAGVGEARP